MTLNRYISTLLLLLMAALYLSEKLSAQIESDAEVPFTEESLSDFTNIEEFPKAPEPTDIELVPASTVRDLNLPSPRFRIFQRRPSDPHRLSKQSQNSLAEPPAFVRDTTIQSDFNTIASEEYLYHIASTHPWGRFPEGAWKRIRVVRSEDSLGIVKRIASRKSAAEYTITLSQILPDQFSLTYESDLSGGGRKWSPRPQVTGNNYWEESVDMKPVSFKTKDNLVLEIEGASYPCSWEQIVFENENKRVEIKTWRSDASAHLPSILRQERKIYIKKEGEENQLSISSLYQLSPTSFPYSVMGKVHHVWKSEQTDETSQGKTVTNKLISLTVPGEMVSFDTRQYSPQGELIGQSSGYLVDYGFSCSKNRTAPIRSMFNNIRSWRRSSVPLIPENHE